MINKIYIKKPAKMRECNKPKASSHYVEHYCRKQCTLINNSTWPADIILLQILASLSEEQQKYN